MDASHHHLGMFPPAFPAPPAPIPQPVVPAKREDDDVQFVSSNPVKKRRIDGPKQPIMPPSITFSPPPVEHPAPAPNNHQPHEPAKHTSQPERRGSTGMVDPSPTTHMDVDPMRGCSVPIPARSGYAESFWTAPSTGPKSSPPVSPKTLPEHVTPSMLRLDNNHAVAHGHLSASNGGAASGFSGSMHPINTAAHVSQPPSTGAQGTPAQPNSGNQIQTETVKDTLLADSPLEPTGVTNPGNIVSVPAIPTADEQDGSCQQAATGVIQDHSYAGVEPKTEMTDTVVDFHRINSPAKMPDTQLPHHTHQPASTPSPLISSVHLPAHAFTNTSTHTSTHTPSHAHAPAHGTAHGTTHGTTPTQADTCGNRPASGAKGPCRQCLEARLRQQAANMSAAAVAGLPPVAKAPGTNQTPIASSSMQQPWAHVLGINPYHNPMAGAMYGPLLQQSLMAGSAGPFTVPQQQPHIPHGMSAHQPGGHMLSMGSTPSMPPTQTFVPAQPSSKPAKPATSAPTTQRSKTPETQLTTKHIIVDIADTCLNMFPFEEVAKRHNQPEQKVRDVFSAVIQVPLLRCVADKRRAGKLGTARVKEFNQSRKEAQTQAASAGQTRQDGQGPYMPSAWDMAQFMGPSDVRLGGFSQFSGPW